MGAGTGMLEPHEDGSTCSSAAQAHTQLLPGSHVALHCPSLPPHAALPAAPLTLYLSLICRRFSYGITLRTAFKFSTTSPGMRRGGGKNLPASLKKLFLSACYPPHLCQTLTCPHPEGTNKTWAMIRADPSSFHPLQLSPSVCTHTPICYKAHSSLVPKHRPTAHEMTPPWGWLPCSHHQESPHLPSHSCIQAQAGVTSELALLLHKWESHTLLPTHSAEPKARRLCTSLHVKARSKGRHCSACAHTVRS